MYGFVYVQASTLSHGTSINSVWFFELAIKKTSRPNKAITSAGDAIPILNISVSAPRLWQRKLTQIALFNLTTLFHLWMSECSYNVHIHHPLMLPSLQETLWNYRSKLSEFKANQRTVLPGIAWEVPLLPLVATRRLSKSSLDCCIKEWSWEEIYTKTTLVPRPTVKNSAMWFKLPKVVAFNSWLYFMFLSWTLVSQGEHWGPHIWAVKASGAWSKQAHCSQKQICTKSADFFLSKWVSTNTDTKSMAKSFRTHGRERTECSRLILRLCIHVICQNVFPNRVWIEWVAKMFHVCVKHQ